MNRKPLLPRSEVPEPPKGTQRSSILRFILFVTLFASVVGSIAGLFVVAASQSAPDELDPSPLPRRLMGLAILGLINVGFSAGVWGWKKWGVYGVVCCSLVAFMLNWKVAGMMIALPGLLGPAALSLIAGITWLEFE